MKSFSIVFILIVFVSPMVNCQENLQLFNVDTELLTVSGISAGACFSTQFHVAFSSVIKGMGSWAGAPYLCFAKDGLLCMTTPSIINVEGLVSETERLAGKGDIDATTNLENDRVYIVHGTHDTVVYPKASEKILKFYEHYITESANMVLKNNIPASHAVISDDETVGTPCGQKNDLLYIEDCDFNSVFHMLNHLLGGSLNPPANHGIYFGTLTAFDQNEFFGGDAHKAAMDEIGYVYVPPSCQDGNIQCRLHIFFHGCTMQAENIGTEFIEKAGFLEVADANNIIILFPQTVNKITSTALTGTLGCFNWAGNVGDLLFEEYAKKSALQMSGVYNMLARAAGLSPM